MIALPLFRQTDEEDDELVLESLDDIEAEDIEKEKVFAALSDLEYDYHMGKLSESDYRILKAKYSRQAVAFLKEEETEMDTIEIDEHDIEAEIEAEIRKLSGRDDEDSQLPVKGKSSAGSGLRVCAECSAPLVKAGQKFCLECGAKLE
jgi:hypothetical protein